ncbi:MAG: glycosyl transferase family 1 [Gammaproteobacteria bacterium HGW-Gammaproteobacteria-6]|jgi:glycosyltransferase involved in cell wall biosynthesis|nr:MAG: glycosyl transferase family 1 [Gammaproteobacteria bacterium HGW-Gammaproteobacteria-6]
MAQKRTNRRVKAEPKTESTGILILGMHRSGTSALTRVVNLLGAALGERLMAAGPSNEAGHWEPMAVYEAHEKLLTALGRRWDDFREMPEDWAAHPQAQRCAQSIRRFVADELAGEPLWAVKEPRLCRLLPLWPMALRGLELRLTAVIMVRNPLEVAASLARRDGTDPAAAILLWMQHLIEAERASRQLPRALVCYDGLLADWQKTTASVADQLQIRWPKSSSLVATQVNSFLSPQLRHHRVASDTLGEGAMPALARRLYAACLRASDDASVWGAIAAIADEVEAAAALYGPCLDDVFARGQVAELRAVAAETVVARGFADPERLERQSQFIAEARDGSLQVVAKFEQSAPLLAELAAQVQAQRENVAQAHDASVNALAKLEQSTPLLAELVAQVQTQRENVAQARDASYSVLSKQEQAGPLLAELVAQVQAQREQTMPVIESLVARLEAQGQEQSALHQRLELSQQQLASLATQVAAQDRDIADRDHEIATLTQRVADRDKQLVRAQHLVAQRDGHIDAMHATLSWRITAPLRFIRRQPTRVASAIGRGCRAVYRAVPISWPMRLRIKGMVFRVFAPLLRHTSAWQRWNAQRLGRWYVPGRVMHEHSTQSNILVAASAEPVAEVGLRADYDEMPVAVHVPFSGEPVSANALRARLIAFYLPQFHPIPENDAWWGRGFTEWTNVSKARPQFQGHEQPRLPGELGFYDLRLPEVMRRQIELAKHYGVAGFCFHYYWFAGRRLLEKPMNQLLADSSLDFPFCVCWANENWTRRWDGQDNDVLIGQEHSSENDLHFIQDMEPVLRDPRYIRVDGRLLLVVYRPSLLPDAKATTERWRRYCREQGVGELLLVMAQFDAEDPRPFGFDAAVEFPPHKLAQELPNINHRLQGMSPDYQGYVVDYRDIVKRAQDWPEPAYDMIRGVFPSWDNEARKPGRGYTFAHASPERYQHWLRSAISYARRRPVCGEPLVFVNAWNEWAEGAYLEPDQRHGYAYLQATRDALVGRNSVPQSNNNTSCKRMVVVSHDAHPHGAQYLALNIVRELADRFGYSIDLVLLGDGSLSEAFAQHATVHRLVPDDAPAADDLARLLYAEGARAAMVNTVVSGHLAASLKRAGLRVLCLVHELPGLIGSYGLLAQVKAIAEYADTIVCAATPVQDGICSLTAVDPARIVLRAQGLFTRSRYIGCNDRNEPRCRLRGRLEIAVDSRVVLGLGYGDHRKGIDLFAQVGLVLAGHDRRVHMVWVGHYDEGLVSAIRAQAARRGLVANFHFPGKDFNTDDYYAGADVFALCSREDPFPSVVLEALAVATPVVAFADTGGAEHLLARGCGLLVPAFDVDAFAECVASLLDDPTKARTLGECGAQIVMQEFSFSRYVFDLLNLVGSAVPRISVVVPNYNYAHLLPARLRSIVEQSLPVHELIVLDDASSDNSLVVLEEMRSILGFDFKVVANERNSGCVFDQWLRAVELADGDYVWIAEADDLALPDFLATVVAPLATHEEVVLSYCQSQPIDRDGRVLAADYLAYTNELCDSRWKHPYRASGVDEVNAGLAVKNTIPNVSAVLFRREPLLRALRAHITQIRSLRLAGDWVTYLCLLECGAIAYNPAALNQHRRHDGSVTQGTAAMAHLTEVMRVQQIARQLYRVDAAVQQRAEEYSQTLFDQFGLAASEVRTLAQHPSLRKYLAANAGPAA